jgi:hypothetical protein
MTALADSLVEPVAAACCASGMAQGGLQAELGWFFCRANQSVDFGLGLT